MCVILFKPFGVAHISEEWVKNACDANPHGWGVSIRQRIENEQHSLVTYHGIKDTEALDVVKEHGADSELVFHARWATHGKINVSNCHPFEMYAGVESIVEGQDPFATFTHNGVVRIATPLADYSDTWHLVRLLEKTYGDKIVEFVQRQRWRNKFWNKWGTTNKFLIQTRDAGPFIIGEKLGTWRDGMWASNHSAFAPKTHYWAGWDDEVWDNCSQTFIPNPKKGSKRKHLYALPSSKDSSYPKWWEKQTSDDSLGRDRENPDPNQVAELMDDLDACNTPEDMADVLWQYSVDEQAHAFFFLRQTLLDKLDEEKPKPNATAKTCTCWRENQSQQFTYTEFCPVHAKLIAEAVTSKNPELNADDIRSAFKTIDEEVKSARIKRDKATKAKRESSLVPAMVCDACGGVQAHSPLTEGTIPDGECTICHALTSFSATKEGDNATIIF